jgi:hypothetical protein
LILFGLTSESHFFLVEMRRLIRNSATTDPTYDQVPLRSLHRRQNALPRRFELSQYTGLLILTSPDAYIHFWEGCRLWRAHWTPGALFFDDRL